MGRILIVWFIVSCVVVLITVTGIVCETLYWIGTLLLTHASGRDWAITGWSTAIWGSSESFLLWLAIYCFVVLPISLTLFLCVGALTTRPGAHFAESPIGVARPDRCVVVLTAYDDRDSIGPAVREFSNQSSVRKVLVVDNNSGDGTGQVAIDSGAEVIREPRQGYGFACMRGLAEAMKVPEASTIILAEGDMTFFGDDVPKLLSYIPDADLVVGTRTTRPLTYEGSQMDWFLVWGNLFLALLVRLRYWDAVFIGRLSITDVGCTFRAIRREGLEKILGQLTEGGFSFSPHMLCVALQNNLKIVEVPVRFRQRVGVSKGAGGDRSRAIRMGLGMVWEILSR